MHKEYYYEMLKYKPALFSAIIRDFLRTQNTCPYDEESFEPYFAFQSFLQNKKIQGYVSSYPTDFSWDFSDERRHFVLLSKEELEKLALYFGTALHSKSIAQTLLKEDILQLKEELGEEMYTYALFRGQYQLNTVCDIFKKRNTDLPLWERIRLHGQQVLELVATDWSETEKAKLPQLYENPELIQVPKELKQSIYFALRKILIQEISGEWA